MGSVRKMDFVQRAVGFLKMTDLSSALGIGATQSRHHLNSPWSGKAEEVDPCDLFL
jgi:hypothetical protein